MPMCLTGPASSTDPETWMSYDAALEDPNRRIGFVLGEGIGCIDLDHCLVDGKLSDGAAVVLAMVGSTWIEVSPSGDGLHIWGRFRKAGRCVGSVYGQPVEVYDHARYVTVTGKRFKDAPLVLADLNSVVDKLV